MESSYLGETKLFSIFLHMWVPVINHIDFEVRKYICCLIFSAIHGSQCSNQTRLGIFRTECTLPPVADTT